MMKRGVAVVSWLLPAALAFGCSKKEADEVVAAPRVTPTETTTSDSSDYVGTQTCAGCHEAEHANWLGSHHDLAMQRATEETVLGDFDDAKARYYRESSRFFREGDRFVIEALGADGKLARFPVVYTFGVEPMQQYLVEIEPGRLQSFPFAWDTRPKGEGGQRWFHLQPEEYIEPGDPLHWTGPSYNWNHACADCHSTAVKKNYDRATRRYATDYFEIDVGCEACHGRGSLHVELVESKADPLPRGAGFERRFPTPAERVWAFEEGRDIAVLTSGQSTEPEFCAPCHSRRSDLGGEHAGFYHDRYRLSALDEMLYFDDGQIRDEVYVYGSFLQSRMHAAGVVCSDCHDGHSSELRAEGNALCSRCHKAAVYDVPQHHFHEAGGEGSRCTDCHMPKRPYMVLDYRGDHRFGLPQPALSAAVGAPNACTQCHQGRSIQWAERQIDKHFDKRATHAFAGTFHAARNQQPEGEPGLAELVAVGTAPAIVRATALLELRLLGSPALPALLMRAASDESAVVRRSVAVAARDLPPEQRVEILRPLLRDRARTVRIEAVGSILGTDARDWRATDKEALKRATTEYLAARSFNSDRGEGLVDLAHVAALSGDFQHAEENLREALDIDPTFTAAYVNLADLYRGQRRDQDAETILRRALGMAADRSAVEFSLGLTLVRLGRHDEALAFLRRAYETRPETIRFGYVYAVAQFDTGRQAAALRTLERIHKRYPANREVLQLLAGYNQQLGRAEAAKKYATKLDQLNTHF
jgi:predicted CXXCH cytochrome family protein